MIQRDFILRMIEEMGKFLSRLLRLKKQGFSQKGFQEFDTFLDTRFSVSTDNLMKLGVEESLNQLKEPLLEYPDEMGQLLLSGADLAMEINERAKAQVLFQLAWEAMKKAEKESNTYRFERLVEMNSIKQQLGLMGVIVGE